MKVKTKHEKFGEIEYFESAWTGKKELSINGQKLEKIDKTSFKLKTSDKETTAVVSGNYLSGSKLTIENEVIQITPAIKWYEYLLSAMIILLVCVWGNVVELCMIVPILGGAIGGAISGLFAIVNLIVMKRTSKVWIKLLIWLGFMALTFAVCYGGAMIYLSML